MHTDFINLSFASFLRYKSDDQMLERKRGRMERGRKRERWAAEGCTWHRTHPSCKTPASCCPWRRLAGAGSDRAAACALIGRCPARAWGCSWSCGWCESGCRSCRSGWIRSLRGEHGHREQTLKFRVNLIYTFLYTYILLYTIILKLLYAGCRKGHVTW